MTPEFEWNALKAEANLKSHGVFEEALTVFADPLGKIFSSTISITRLASAAS